MRTVMGSLGTRVTAATFVRSLYASHSHADHLFQPRVNTSAVIILKVEVRMLSRENKERAQGHTARQQRSWDLNSGLFDFHTHALQS